MEGSKFINSLKDKILDDIYSCLPAKITKVYDDKKIDAQPLFTLSGNKLPQVVQIPLLFMGNGTSIINIESKVGDYVLLLVADYDIDNLVIDGKNKEVNTQGKHNIDDCFALPFSFTPFNSTKSQVNKINISTGGDITIESSNLIKLGEGATEGVALGDSLKSWLDSHSHNYSWTHDGGSGTTDAPLSGSPETSNKVVVE